MKSHQIWPFENSQVTGAQKRFFSFYQISFLKTHSLLDIFQVGAHEYTAAEGLNLFHLTWKPWIFGNHVVAPQSLIWLLS